MCSETGTSSIQAWRPVFGFRDRCAQGVARRWGPLAPYHHRTEEYLLHWVHRQPETHAFALSGVGMDCTRGGFGNALGLRPRIVLKTGRLLSQRFVFVALVMTLGLRQDAEVFRLANVALDGFRTNGLVDGAYRLFGY